MRRVRRLHSECRDAYGNPEPCECKGDAFAEPSFSHSQCDICGCPLGGNREPFHWIDAKNVIQHADGACSDCCAYMANGDIPPDECLDWLD